MWLVGFRDLNRRRALPLYSCVTLGNCFYIYAWCPTTNQKAPQLVFHAIASWLNASLLSLAHSEHLIDIRDKINDETTYKWEDHWTRWPSSCIWWQIALCISLKQGSVSLNIFPLHNQIPLPNSQCLYFLSVFPAICICLSIIFIKTILEKIISGLMLIKLNTIYKTIN